MNTRTRVRFVTLMWFVVGLVVAVNKGYGHNLDSGSRTATFILAVVLWPVLVADGTVAVSF